KAGMHNTFVDRKHGRQKISYEHPDLEPILKDTYGCIVYQEQVMEIAKSLASFTPGEADGLRKAMGKKIPEEMEKQRGRFVEGCKKNGIDAKLADKIYSQIDKFGGYGFNKCVAGSTRIFDAGTGRPWTAAELCRSGRKVRVCALGPDGKVVIRRVRHAWSNGEKPVFRLRTALGKEIRATGNHPFYTFGGWKELKDLRSGDRIAVPRALPIPGGTRWPRRRAALLGWVLSEGNTCHPSGFYLYTKSRRQAADMLASLRAFPNTAATVRRRRGLHEIYARNAGGRGISGARAWLDSLGVSGLKATKKHVPGAAFSLDAGGLAVLAGRLWAGDGFVCTRDNHVPFYATSSSRLAADVQELLLRLGILSRVAEKTFKYRGDYRLGYAVHLITRESVERFLKLVGPHVVGKASQIRRLRSRLGRLREDRMSKDTVPIEVRALIRTAKAREGVTWAEVEAGAGVSVEELHRVGGAKKGFRRWTIAELAEYFSSDELRRLAVSDIYWDTISEIVPDGREETFDLEVPGAHNFVAGGIFVHNSHTVAYGTLAYQTGYLKANYPIEYVCALLTSEIGHSAVDVEDKENKLVTYISDASSMGIQVLAPDVRRSEAAFSIEGSSIRFGLTAVKNVGSSAAQAICAARLQEPFSSLDDFCRRVDLRAVNRKTIESLIKAGGMDSLLPDAPAGAARARLMSVLEETMSRQAQVKEDLARGQGLLFGTEPQGGGVGAPGQGGAQGAGAALAPWPEHELLQNEKEVLGFYLSGHPLVRVKDLLACCAARPIGDLDAQSPAAVRLAGLRSSGKRVVTKTGEPMALAVLEDLSGEISLLVFPKAYAAGLNKNLKADSVVVVAGRLSWRGDLKGEEGQGRPELIVEEIIPLEAAVGRYARALTLRFSTAGADENFLADLRRILRKYPGRTPVHLRLETPAHGEAVVETEETVALGDGLFGELGAMLGDRAWQIESGAS
ncbi:MAG: LAGLIDADG family homing endonuclease, partial [Elusimicrobiota bacterium]